MPITDWGALTLSSAHTSTDRVTESVPIGSTSGNQKRVLYWLILPVAAGQILRVQARARITNDVDATRRYTVGFGFWNDSYDVDDGVPYASKTWTRIGPLYGDNVTKDRHHMPCDVFDDYEIPAGWVAGHRIRIAMRGDAASTSTSRVDGDTLDVDDYGRISVWVYDPPAT